MSSDYLSINDEKRVDLLQNVYNTTETNLTTWEIQRTELEDWKQELKTFADAVETLKSPANRTTVATCFKDTAWKSLSLKVRPFIQARLIRNRNVTRPTWCRWLCPFTTRIQRPSRSLNAVPPSTQSQPTIGSTR
jgi:hypothetical protein